MGTLLLICPVKPTARPVRIPVSISQATWLAARPSLGRTVRCPTCHELHELGRDNTIFEDDGAS
jgi:hypothetical protein